MLQRQQKCDTKGRPQADVHHKVKPTCCRTKHSTAHCDGVFVQCGLGDNQYDHVDVLTLCRCALDGIEAKSIMLGHAKKRSLLRFQRRKTSIETPVWKHRAVSANHIIYFCRAQALCCRDPVNAFVRAPISGRRRRLSSERTTSPEAFFRARTRAGRTTATDATHRRVGGR